MSGRWRRRPTWGPRHLSPSAVSPSPAHHRHPHRGLTRRTTARTTPRPPLRPLNPPGGAMEPKLFNDAVAYIRALAEERGRNVDWAEQAVRGAASLSSTAALQQKVIGVIARGLPEPAARMGGL